MAALRRLGAPLATGARAKSAAVEAAVEAALGAEAGVEEVERDGARPYAAMPGPTPLPLLGNTWRFLPVIGDYRVSEVDRVALRLHQRCGRAARLSGLLGRPDMVFLFDADDVEAVFRAEGPTPHRPSMPSLDAYKHALRKHVFAQHPGVIAVHGERWASFRSRVQRVLLQPAAAAHYLRPVEEVAHDFVLRSRQLKEAHPDQLAPPDFMNEIHKWSLESLARVTLGERLGCVGAAGAAPGAAEAGQRLIHAVTTFFSLVGHLELKAPVWRLFPTPAWRRYVQALDDITQVTRAYTSAALERWGAGASGGGRRAVGDGAPLLERVLAHDGDPAVASALALDLFLVGIDTTSTAVASVLYQLALHPDKQEKLHREVKRELPTEDSLLATDALRRMPYLRAVIRETLRMYPVVIGNGRTMTEDTVVAGYRIPKGTQLVFQHYVMSNAERYFPQAHRFLPERWLRPGEDQDEGSCPAAAHKSHPFASLPFGFGRRMCLGRRFADLEIQTVVAKMVRAFRMEWPHARLQYRIHPMYTPDGPLRFRLVDRH